jgi:hypothetical protein
VGSSREQPQHPRGVRLVPRLAEYQAVDYHDRIRAENRLAGPVNRAGFGFGEPPHMVARAFAG